MSEQHTGVYKKKKEKKKECFVLLAFFFDLSLTCSLQRFFKLLCRLSNGNDFWLLPLPSITFVRSFMAF